MLRNEHKLKKPFVVLDNCMNKLLWLPIDYPKIPDISPLLISSVLNEEFAFWKFLRLTERKESPYEINEWKLWIRNSYPHLVSWIEGLPFSNIRNIKLNFQTSKVKGHIDFVHPDADPELWENNNSNEPCGYRILVKGSRQNCLWVKDQSYTCNMPETTNVYVINHTEGLHGVNDDEDRWTIFCHGEIDPIQHKILLERSLSRYKKYAIWNNV